MRKECVMMKTFRYLKGSIRLMSFGFLIKVIGTLMDLVIPLILAYIIDEVTKVNKIIVLGLVMIGCSIIAMLFNVIANYFASLTARRFTRKMRHDLFVKINSLSMSQIDNLTTSSVMSRMSTDTYNIHQMVMIMQRMGVRAPILLIGGIVMTYFLDPTLTLILLATLPLITFVIMFFTFKGFPLFSKVQLRIDDMVRTMRENITGVRVIKALSKKDYEEERFEKVNKNVFDSDLKASKNMAKINPLINLFLNIGLVAVIFVGAFRVDSGIIKAGVIISFTTYFTIILNAMVSMTRIFMIYSKAFASSKRIEEIFNMETDLCVLDDVDQKEGSFIEFNDVSFAYLHQKNVLENINIKLQKGDSLGIIGATGSGKSTLINLLMRFYDCDGKIYIDGLNIKNYNLHELRKIYGVSFQNDAILNDTIKNNIVFGREYDEAWFKKVCEISCVNSFAADNSDGYDKMITARGTNLSGGQKQRILIARSIYSKPKVLILDDATSALDYKTDSYIRRRIKEEFPDITLIYVSSRVSSIMNFTKIIVLDNGRIVEEGRHEDLINKESGIYKDIYTIQIGGVENEF